MDRLEESTSAISLDETVTIKSETDDRVFRVSKAILCASCDHFKAALERGFEEASTKHLSLPGTDDDAIRVFMFWLVKRKMPNFGEEVAALTTGAEEAASERILLLARTWMLGHMVILPALQNAAMDEILEIMRQRNVGAAFEALKDGFALATDDSPLQLVFATAARHSYFWQKNLSDEELGEPMANPGFATRFMGVVRKFIRKRESSELRPFEAPWKTMDWNFKVPSP